MREVHAARRSLMQRTVYQCPSCHRLVLDAPDRPLAFFAPDDPATAARLLDSTRGDAWPRHIRGHWRSDKGRGELYVAGAGDDEGIFDSDIPTWEALEARYLEQFRRLEALKRVRDSFLERDGVIVHRWPT